MKINYSKYIFNKFTKNVLILLTAFVLVSCNAPRSNPLDPQSENYSLGIINGSVQTYSIPYSGIFGVNVFWQNGGELAQTDSLGNFKIDRIKPIDGNLIFQKNGFRSDTVFLVWGNTKVLNPQVNLNRIPQIDSISIYTMVINQYYPPQTSELIINTKIIDPDNDIATVYVRNSQLGLNKALDFSVTEKNYQTILSTSDLNINDIEQTIGLDFNIYVKDVFNHEFMVGSEKVTRVIKNGVSINSPANDTTLTSTPDLTWRRFLPGYPFTYMVEVYTSDFANSQLVVRQNNISMDSLSYHLNSTLPSGNYYWVIWAIDQYGNRSRSLPATFKIQ